MVSENDDALRWPLRVDKQQGIQGTEQSFMEPVRRVAKRIVQAFGPNSTTGGHIELMGILSGRCGLCVEAAIGAYRHVEVPCSTFAFETTGNRFSSLQLVVGAELST